jgi:hypothetical protein
MTFRYKITNHVLDEIDLTSSFNFLVQVIQHLANDSQDLYRKKGKNKKSMGERTNPCKNCSHNKNFRGVRPKRERNGKNRPRTEQEQGKIGRHYCSTLVGSAHYEEETKQRNIILTLVSLYPERETRLFSLLKGDMT